MPWQNSWGTKGPLGHRLQVVVTLCSPMPWQSIGGATAPLGSIPFEVDPLFPQHPGRALGEQRVSWPRRVQRGPEGPESFRMTQRCSERPREAHVDLDSKSSSFSLFVRMRCVDKNASQSSHFGEDICWNACNACRH